MLRSYVCLPLIVGALAWSAWPASLSATVAVDQQHPPAGGASKPKKKVDVHKVVEAGLVWLARHQSDDGSWGAHRLTEKCGETKCFVPKDDHDHYDVGLTGLAVLAFLRAGYSPTGTKEIVDPLTKSSYKTGEVVTRALEWLAKGQIATGEFASADQAYVYDEALAELAMSDAYALAKEERWKDSAQRGANALVDGQRANPAGKGLWGWRYVPRGKAPLAEASDSDTSATGWCIVALSAAQDAGLKVPKASFDGALEFASHVTGKDGKVGYLDAENAGVKVTGPDDKYDYHIATMSALAITICCDSGSAVTNPFFDLAAKQILADLPRASTDGLSVDYYYWYQGTAALNRLEELQPKKGKPKKYAEPWNPALIEVAASLQDAHADRCSLGGWVTSDRWSHTGGPVYATAMMILSLERTQKK